MDEGFSKPQVWGLPEHQNPHCEWVSNVTFLQPVRNEVGASRDCCLPASAGLGGAVGASPSLHHASRCRPTARCASAARSLREIHWRHEALCA